MRIFVTGGSGFLGSNLVDRLLRIGHDITVYDKVFTSNLSHARTYSGFHFVEGDILDKDFITSSMVGHDTVIHLAANADVRGGISHPTRDLEQNVLATSSVLESMRLNRVGRIVFSSTALVYGEPDVFPTPETCPFPIQTSLYGASKIASEGLISAYAHGFGIKATIFRFVPIIGERYAHGHLFDWWNKLKTDPSKIEIIGNGLQRKSVLYVGDCMDAILIGSELENVTRFRRDSPVEIFNVGGSEPYTINQSLDWVCEEMMLTPKRAYTGGDRGWAGDSPRILLDISKMNSLGWYPKVSTKEAVIRTIRSFM